MRHFVLLLIFCAGLAGAKKPLTHEAMWLMKRVGAPIPSPDGKWVVFTVVEPAYEAKEQVSDLWVVPGDGSAPPRKLTFTRGTESGVTWSPDSRRIAFSATREGDVETQIYVLPVVGGGEAERRTNLATGASDPKWSPDGKRILFTSMVGPENAKPAKTNARVFDGFPIRHWDHWLDGRHAHLFVMADEAGAPAKDLLTGTRFSKTAGYAGVASNSGEDLSPAWTPDSQSIVFQAEVNRNQAAFATVRTKIFLLPAAGGEPQPLTQGQFSYSAPKFRPDGKALYVIETRDGVDGKTYSLNRLAMMPWPQGGVPRVVSETLDRSIDGFQFTPDSKMVFFTAEEGGMGKLFGMPAEGGAAGSHPQKEGNYTNLAISGDGMGFLNFESATNPAEIVRLDRAKREERRLTHFNDEALAELDLPPLKNFYFTSKKGRSIHNLLVLPPAFDPAKKYPLLVLIHGGPHNMWKDQFFLRWNYHLLASPGYVVLLTNYTGSTGFGEKFAQNIQLDPLETPGNELIEAADEAIRLFPYIDSTRQAAGGASYGGHLANWLQATTTRFRCLISHAGLVNLETQWGTSDSIYSRELNNGGPVWEQGEVWRKQNPIRYAAKFKTPVLVTVGERDFRVPLNNTLEYWSVLQRLQIPSRLIVFPDANHWIQKGEDSRFFYQQVTEWLGKWLK